jgi:hypothetical protein
LFLQIKQEEGFCQIQLSTHKVSIRCSNSKLKHQREAIHKKNWQDPYEAVSVTSGHFQFSIPP